MSMIIQSLVSVISDDDCLVYYKEEDNNVSKLFTLAFALYLKTSLDVTMKQSHWAKSMHGQIKGGK